MDEHDRAERLTFLVAIMIPVVLMAGAIAAAVLAK